MSSCVQVGALMFTGIITGRGEILSLESRQGEARLSIKADWNIADLQIGESIAVNGACLSVEKGSGNFFSMYASAETMSRTTLGTLRNRSRVNLERALAVGDRLGGHIVSGHVDCVAKVEKVLSIGESRRIRLSFPSAYAQEVVAKGSVALDGISLTINDCGVDFLEVNVIPETWRTTTVSQWTSGSGVNMETDILGKYVRRMLTLDTSEKTPKTEQTRLSREFLSQHGFC